MSGVRKILSARAARPRVAEMLEALVEAAAFIGRADGRFSEAELNVFIDSLREVVSAAVGDEAVESLASTPRLLDLARAARGKLLKQGRASFLEALAPRFPGAFARDGLILAYRIVLADGQVTPEEAAAFRELASAFGLEVAETEVLEALAHPGRGPAGSAAVEQVNALRERGWVPVPDSAMDASARYPRPGGALDVELDATDGTLHVLVAGDGAAGPHLLFRFGDALPGLLAVLEALKESLTPATLDEKLPALRAVCPDLFVERDGRFARG
jgi:tellurite resistance protein